MADQTKFEGEVHGVGEGFGDIRRIGAVEQDVINMNPGAADRGAIGLDLKAASAHGGVEGGACQPAEEVIVTGLPLENAATTLDHTHEGVPETTGGPRGVASAHGAGGIPIYDASFGMDEAHIFAFPDDRREHVEKLGDVDDSRDPAGVQERKDVVG